MGERAFPRDDEEKMGEFTNCRRAALRSISRDCRLIGGWREKKAHHPALDSGVGEGILHY